MLQKTVELLLLKLKEGWQLCQKGDCLSDLAALGNFQHIIFKGKNLLSLQEIEHCCFSI